MTADRTDSFWPLAGDPVGPNQAHAARDSSPHLGEARPAGSSGQGDRRAYNEDDTSCKIEALRLIDLSINQLQEVRASDDLHID